MEDKHRYDQEQFNYKNGNFNGKSQTLIMKQNNNYNQANYQDALIINEDIINFL